MKPTGWMKFRLTVSFILFVPIAGTFAAYTEFYCQNGGSNLNAGSTTNNTALYTSTNGGWNSGTKIFTPTDGTNPVSAGVAVGMWASVYIDGASVGVYVGRISAVTNAANGTITADVVPIGSAPSTSASARTIKVGGAWQGPNGASGFPFTLTSYGVNKNASGQAVRTNLKNDQTYSITSSISFATAGGANLVQGYTGSVGDHGLATIDGGTSTGAIIADAGTAGNSFADIIFKTSITTGTTDLVLPIRTGCDFTRCVFTGARKSAIVVPSLVTTVTECEFYDCNKSNTAGVGIINVPAGTRAVVSNTIFHDNTGNNAIGILIAGTATVNNSVFDTNGKYGIGLTGTTTSNGMVMIENCDFYNNTSDAINADGTTNIPITIKNCNFIKNGGKGINYTNSSTGFFGYVFNCGYGAGTQANGSSDTLNALVRDGTDVTYANDVTPWVDPANGDFSINLDAAKNAGRGAFTETASSYAGTVGYPDIGAAPNANPTPTSTPTATPTVTPTPTTPPETSHTFGG